MAAYSAKALATREKILRAANDLFYLHGYNATGLDRIIAEAGVAKGNFYHHFKSKEELAEAVLDWHRDRAFEEIGVDLTAPGPSPLATLLGFLEGMAQRTTCPTPECEVRGCFFGNFALELSTGSQRVRAKVNEIFGMVREGIRDLIARGQARGEIRSDLDPARTAGMVLGLMEGAVLLDKASQRPEEVGQALEFIRSYLAA